MKQARIAKARVELGDLDVVGEGVRDFDGKPRSLEANRNKPQNKKVK